MDLSSLGTAAAISKYAVVFLASGGAVATYVALYFAVNKNDKKRLQAQFVAVVLAAFGAVAGYSVYYITDEISIQREKLAKEKETEFERFKVEKGAEIASAGARAAEANELALKLENANLVLRGKVATLETQLAKVSKRQEPRSSRMRKVKDKILSRLRTAPPGIAMILYQQANAESTVFATELQMVLIDAGWQLRGVRAIPSTIERGAGFSDISLGMRDISQYQLHNSIETLQVALSEADFSADGWFDPKLPDDTLRIFIHPKP